MTTATWHREDRRLLLFVRNVGSRYRIIVINAVLGLLLVPFNLEYLGVAAYGLWMLTASITTYFSVLELGYGSATLKYVAEYRAKGDARAQRDCEHDLSPVHPARAGVLRPRHRRRPGPPVRVSWSPTSTAIPRIDCSAGTYWSTITSGESMARRSAAPAL